MDEASGQNVIDDLYLTISNRLADFWTLGFWLIPGLANLAGLSPCIWNLAPSFLLCGTVVKEVRPRTSREIS